jgi:6-phosphogluconolactonase
MADRFLVYIGSYTGEHSKGIHAFRFDSKSGEVEDLGLAAETPSPSFLALHPNGRFLYAANETDEFRGKRSGSVTAFAIDASTGKLRELSQVASRGPGTCHLVVDRTGHQVLAANYWGGSVASFPIAPDGSVGEAGAFFQHVGTSVNKARQGEPHAHSVNVSPDGKHAVVADLGTDHLYIYGFDPAKGLVGPASPDSPVQPAGSGPRHVAFHPSGKYAYAINEMLSTITVFHWAARQGALHPVQTVSTLPVGVPTDNTSTAEVVVHPTGRFVYGSNRGHDSIAMFRVDGSTGNLTPMGHHPTGGKVPRNFNIDPTGQWLWAANQGSHTITLHRIDPKTGLLTATGKELKAGAPVCVKFLRIP